MIAPGDEQTTGRANIPGTDDDEDVPLPVPAIQILRSLRDNDQSFRTLELDFPVERGIDRSRNYLKWFMELNALLSAKNASVKRIKFHTRWLESISEPAKAILFDQLVRGLPNLEAVMLLSEWNSTVPLKDIKPFLRVENLKELDFSNLSFSGRSDAEAFAESLMRVSNTLVKLRLHYIRQLNGSHWDSLALDTIVQKLLAFPNLQKLFLVCKFQACIEPSTLQQLLGSSSLRCLYLEAAPRWSSKGRAVRHFDIPEVVEALAKSTLQSIHLAGFYTPKWNDVLDDIVEQNLAVQYLGIEGSLPGLPETDRRAKNLADMLGFINRTGRKKFLDPTTSREECIPVLAAMSHDVSALWKLLRKRPELCCHDLPRQRKKVLEAKWSLLQVEKEQLTLKEEQLLDELKAEKERLALQEERLLREKRTFGEDDPNEEDAAGEARAMKAPKKM